MAVDPQIKAQWGQIISIDYSTGTANAYGEVQVGVSVSTYPCRWENRQRGVEREDGTFIVTHLPVLLLDSDVATPTFDSRFWQPGDSPSTPSLARRAKAIFPVPNEFGGLDHWEIML